MIVLQTIAVALSMFSAVPMPQFDWNERNMRYALCAFPLVGVLCALCWAVLAALPLPAFLRGTLLCMAPAAVTGGIHLDGYADTADALASFGDQAKKQAILKDPHCGAFAVIRLISWFLLYMGLCVTFDPTWRAVCCAGLGFVLSRALSGWAIAALPMAKDTGLAHTFASTADKKTVGRALGVLAILLAAGQIILGGWAGAAMAGAAGLVLWWYARVAAKQFGGISGDLAGWFLQKCELWQLAALVSCQLMGVGP